jgi:hypothetical protein
MLLTVKPESSAWVVVCDAPFSRLSRHTTADAAVRAAEALLADDDHDGQLVVRDRYARTQRYERSAHTPGTR